MHIPAFSCLDWTEIEMLAAIDCFYFASEHGNHLQGLSEDSAALSPLGTTDISRVGWLHGRRRALKLLDLSVDICRLFKLLKYKQLQNFYKYERKARTFCQQFVL